jgi:uncharacterized protein (TIGR00251 family)
MPENTNTDTNTDTSADWLDRAADHCLVRLRIQPGAKRTAVVGVLGDRLKVAIAAPPVDGKANAALLQWLAKTLKLKRAQVTLVSGTASKDKRVRLETTKAAQIRVALDDPASQAS